MLSLGTKVSIGAGRSRVLDVAPGGGVSLAMFCLSASADSEWEVYVDRAVNDLARPAQPTFTLSTSLGQLPASTKVYVRVTAVDALGVEGPCSPGAKFATTGAGTTNRVTAAWVAVTGAATYKVYAGSKAGMEALVGSTAGTSLAIDAFPVDDVRGVPTTTDMMMATLKNQSTNPAIGGSVSINASLVIFATLQVAGDVFITCLVA